jgi:preprotein translocase subunit YajC
MDISLLFPLLILLLFIPIFLSGRRQRRQMQEMQKLQASVEPDDVVVTTSGLRGTIVDASYEDTVDIEIADGVVTTWSRAAIREKVNPVADEDSPSDEELSDEELSDKESSDDDSSDAEPVQEATTSLEKTSSVEKDDSSNGSRRS